MAQPVISSSGYRYTACAHMYGNVLHDLQRALRLSQQQRAEIVQLRRIFLNKMNAIAQQRHDIHQSLAVCCIQPCIVLQKLQLLNMFHPAPSPASACLLQGSRMCMLITSDPPGASSLKLHLDVLFAAGNAAAELLTCHSNPVAAHARGHRAPAREPARGAHAQNGLGKFWTGCHIGMPAPLLYGVTILLLQLTCMPQCIIAHAVRGINGCLAGGCAQVMTLLKHTLTPVQVARLLVQVCLLVSSVHHPAETQAQWYMCQWTFQWLVV
jgi:hypothetical protein